MVFLTHRGIILRLRLTPMYRAGQISIRRYQSDDASEWNAFLTRSKNATFLFHRDYLSYHAQRFQDHSLIIEREGEIAARFLLPMKKRIVLNRMQALLMADLFSIRTRVSWMFCNIFYLLKYYSNGFRLRDVQMPACLLCDACIERRSICNACVAGEAASARYKFSV